MRRAIPILAVIALGCLGGYLVRLLTDSTTASYVVGVAGAAVGLGALVPVLRPSPKQDALSAETIDSSVRKAMQPLLALAPALAAHLSSSEVVAESLFVCTARQQSTLGFAVNNSGMLVCPSAVGPVHEVTNVRTGVVEPATVQESKRMLQAVSIGASTRGLVPAYRSQPEFGEELFALDASGGRCPVHVDSIHLTAEVASDHGGFLVTDAFMARFDPAHELIGGPVLTSRNEVLGIAVAATSLGYLIVQPWSQLDRCIDMEVSAPPTSKSQGAERSPSS